MADGRGPTVVSLVTVLYGGRETIGDCIRSVLLSAGEAGCDVEVILIDNRPGDGTAQTALEVEPNATIISNDKNVGFGRACNQGFGKAHGDWWLLLNPDARLEPAALGKLVRFIATSDTAGAVAPTLDSPGRNRATNGGMLPGVRSALGHFWWLNRMLPGDRGGPWRGLLLQRRRDLGPRRVEWLSGGALLLRPRAVRELGGFDPSFFLYAEDVDLGRRLQDAGWDSWILPDATGTHSVASSSGGVTDRWYIALHDYHALRAGRLSLTAFDLIAASGLALRAVAARKDRRHRRQMITAARTALRMAFDR